MRECVRVCVCVCVWGGGGGGCVHVYNNFVRSSSSKDLEISQLFHKNYMRYSQISTLARLLLLIVLYSIRIFCHHPIPFLVVIDFFCKAFI